MANFDKNGKILSIDEKPKAPKTNIAVTGLYFYTNEVVDIANSIKPSKRGEYEITSLNNEFIKRKKLEIERLPRGMAWLDTGTHHSMMQASQFVYAFEERSGVKIACLEEIAFRNSWISHQQLDKIIYQNNDNPYYLYLQTLKNEIN